MAKGREIQKARKEGFGKVTINNLCEFIQTVDKGEGMGMRRVKLTLEPRAYTNDEIKWTREQLRVSQAIFAQLFGVSVKTVEAWEAGTNPIPGPVCRLLEEININPMSFLRRHLEARATELLAQ